jgi:hypothetical protein
VSSYQDVARKAEERDTLPLPPKQRRIAMSFKAVFGAVALLTAAVHRLSEHETRPLLLTDEEAKMVVEEYSLFRSCIPNSIGNYVDVGVEKITPLVSFPVCLVRISLTKTRYMEALLQAKGRGGRPAGGEAAAAPQGNPFPTPPDVAGNGQDPRRNPTAPYIDPGLLT